jgi:hypothetical protein
MDSVLLRRAVLVGLASGIVASCATQTKTSTFYIDDGVTTSLRHESSRGVAVERGFTHPTQISSERLSDMLASIVIRSKDGDTFVEKQAIASELVAGIARGLSASFAAAKSSEEIALVAVRRERRLGVFTKKYLTSFVAFTSGNELTVSLARVEWDTARDRQSRGKRNKLPQPHLGRKVMEFRVVPRDGYAAVGEQMARFDLSHPRWDVAAVETPTSGSATTDAVPLH